jgi:hypothetical protein
MIYRFACPVPCNREISINADTDADAIQKIISAGALSCRNIANRSYCEKYDKAMFSLPANRLMEIVRENMKLSQEEGR